MHKRPSSLEQLQGLPVRRRELLASFFIAGYAAAAGARKVTDLKSPTDVRVEEVLVTAADGYRLPAYLARPQGRGKHPALIVIHETFGVHEYIKRTSHELARLGYVAVVPDYYDRVGDAAVLPNWDSIRPLVAATPQRQVLSDTGAMIDWLLDRPFVVGDNIGTIGFCWGGMMVWLLCAHDSRLRTGISWYGLLETPSYGTPPAPIDVAAQLKSPVLGLYGGRDPLIPRTLIDKMRASLPRAGLAAASRIDVFANASHGFHADYRQTYDPEAATIGWERMKCWLARHMPSGR